MASLSRCSLLLLGLALVVTACDDPANPQPIDAPPTLSHAIHWAGGVVRLTDVGIAAGDPAPALSLEGVALEAVAAGGGWAEYRLPRDARGPVTLTLAHDEPVEFQLEILGFRGAETLDAPLRGNLFVWPRTGPASMLGLTDDNIGVLHVLPGAGTADYILDDSIFSEARAIGPTSDPDVVLVSKGMPELWRLLPTPELVDSLPLYFIRHAMLLSDEVYVWSGHHDINVQVPSEPIPYAYTAMYEESQGAAISPDGQYGVMEINGSALGVPVFGESSGEPLYHVTSISHTDGVDFSPVGDTLYLGGMRSAEPRVHVVVALELATGQLVSEELALDGFNLMTVRRDPNGPWLFAFGLHTGETLPVLLVIDSRTMEVVGEIATSGYTGCAEALGCDGALAVGTDGIFYVTTNDHPAANRDIPATILAFDGWPAD